MMIGTILCVKKKDEHIKIKPVETIPRKGSKPTIDTLVETVDYAISIEELVQTNRNIRPIWRNQYFNIMVFMVVITI